MSEPGMWLEIRRGKTNFPLRPISGDRFLIGAGSHCHLQLGGDDFPMLHSLLVIEGKTAHLEAVVSDPPLLINGESRRDIDLQDEDLVSIGQFEFVFHRLVASEPSAQVATTTEHCEVTPSDESEDLSELSTARLVELIEEESRQISQFNRGREMGAIALLQAARRAEQPSHPVSVSLADFRSEPSLTELAEQLRLQSQRLAESEAEWVRRAATLLEAQAAIALQMADFASQLSAWTQSGGPGSMRASA